MKYKTIRQLAYFRGTIDSMATFPFYKQYDSMDCGPTCLRMIARYHGKSYSLQTLRDRCFIDREGVSMRGTSYAAESIGFHTMVVKLPFVSDGDGPSLQDVPLPCIAHWKQKHMVVVHKANEEEVHVADPAYGDVKMTRKEFEAGWLSDRFRGDDTGVLLLLETTPQFFSEEEEKIEKTGFGFLWRYLRQYRRLWAQLVMGLLLASGLQLIFPFLTKAIVDVGIANQDIAFIWILLGAQLTLFVSQAALQFIRGWILLHIGARVNVSIISDFLSKLMRLPIKFFDAKSTGDLMQRIQDHYRIEMFLTANTLGTLFSLVHLLVFGIVLLIFNPLIFGIFVFAGILYGLWILYFLKSRKVIDYKRFQQLGENQSKLIQLFTSMQEIKLQNSEQHKRWEWERVQVRLFKTNTKAMALDQKQEAGGVFINELKNIVITFVAAKSVMDGHMTLGMMLAVQYIIGQMNAPLNQLLGFVRAAQDAKFSLERLGEIHRFDDEDDPTKQYSDILPERKDLVFEKVFFKYNELTDWVLKDINLVIPEGKVTAFVGSSGSGKTTLLKLLLKFYDPGQGTLKIGEAQGGHCVEGSSLKNFSSRFWREHCGAVMQDGFIFSDTIAHNIAVGVEQIDKARLVHSAKMANILPFIESLPLGFNTKIGPDGLGVSQGQRQRILIARAIYKNPPYLFFDEATNALDANNERAIVQNLQAFFENRTVVVVAHRLSTVRHADQIIVLHQGEIIERGTHDSLTALKGAYYELIKNQLEMGNE